MRKERVAVAPTFISALLICINTPTIPTIVLITCASMSADKTLPALCRVNGVYPCLVRSDSLLAYRMRRYAHSLGSMLEADSPPMLISITWHHVIPHHIVLVMRKNEVITAEYV